HHLRIPQRRTVVGQFGIGAGVSPAPEQAGETPAPQTDRLPGARSMSRHHFLYGKNFPSSVTLTRSPFGSGVFSMFIVKSIALMMPSPKVSWINAFNVVP